MNVKVELQQLILEIPKNLHKELKQRALDRNITLKNYVLQAILSKISEEKKYE